MALQRLRLLQSLLLLSFAYIQFLLICETNARNLAPVQEEIIVAEGDIIEFGEYDFIGLVMEVKPNSLVVKSYGHNDHLWQSDIRPSNVSKVLDSLTKRKTKERERESSFREWESGNGKFKLNAAFEGVEAGDVRLKKENGESILVPLGKLSAKDQQYVQKHKAASLLEIGPRKQLPPKALLLKTLRDETNERELRHRLLSKESSDPEVGDILLYRDSGFNKKLTHGIVSSLDLNFVYLKIIEDGKIKNEIHNFLLAGNWWFVDRSNVTLAPPSRRNWKSPDGSFGVKGKLVEVDGSDVVLEKLDGTTVSIPLLKLRKTDRQYVEVNQDLLSLFKHRKSKHDHLGPNADLLLNHRAELLKLECVDSVAGKVGEAKEIAKTKELARSKAIASVTDTTKTKRIVLNNRPLDLTRLNLKPWQRNAKPFSVKATIQVPRDTRMAEDFAFAEKVGLIAFSLNADDYEESILGVMDTKTGKLHTEKMPANGTVFSISADGRRILVLGRIGWSDYQLEVWSFQNNKLLPESEMPCEQFSEGHLLDNERGYVVGRDGSLLFFDIGDRIEPTHAVASANRFEKVVLSNDKESLLCFGDDGRKMHVIDTNSKTCIGGVAFEVDSTLQFDANNVHVRFDGKSAVLQARWTDEFLVFDLESGKQIDVFTHKTPYDSRLSMKNGFPMLGGNLFHADNQAIFDVKLDVAVGNISGRLGGDNIKRLSRSSRIYSYFGRNRAREDEIHFRSESIDLAKINAAAAAITPLDIIEFGEGAELELSLRLSDEKVKEELKSKLETLLGENGIKIVPKSDFKLTVTYSESRQGLNNFLRRNSARRKTIKQAGSYLRYKGEHIWGVSRRETLAASPEKFNEMSARSILDFNYPIHIRKVTKSKMIADEWKE